MVTEMLIRVKNMSNNKKLISSLLWQNKLLLLSLLMACVGICIMLTVIIWSVKDVFAPQEVTSEPLVTAEPIKTEVPNVIEYEIEKVQEPIIIEDPYVIAQNKFDCKMLELETEELNKLEWYLDYKNILEEYSEFIDRPNTVYDVFTEYEIYLIQRAVETEVFQCSFDAKVNVASVIFNRIADGRFGKNVETVITKPGQFAYSRKKITDDTKLAVEYAFEIGDTTGGCIAFRSDKRPDKWGKWVYSFSDDAVHHFYKEFVDGEDN